MQRICTSTDLGEGKTRHRVHIESDPCENEGIEAMKHVLLHNFADNPALLTCGLVPFQTLRMSHNREVWIIDAEAITQEKSNAKELLPKPSA